MYLWLFCLLGLLLIATASDIRDRRIPNQITYSGIVVALSLAVLAFSPVAVFSALAGFLAAFIFSLLLYLMSGMGGGDVKLLAMVGAFVGWPNIVDVLFYTIVFGVLLAIIYLIITKKMLEMLKGLKTFVQGVFYPGIGVIVPDVNLEIPMAVAISLATLSVIVLRFFYDQSLFSWLM